MNVHNIQPFSIYRPQNSGKVVSPDQRKHTGPAEQIDSLREKSVPSTRALGESVEARELLSPEEAHMFELLFSKEKPLATNLPSKSYSVQKRYDIAKPKQNGRKILGGLLDIRG